MMEAKGEKGMVRRITPSEIQNDGSPQGKSIRSASAQRRLCANTRSCSKFRNTMIPFTEHFLVTFTYQIILSRASLPELLLLLLPTLSSIHPWLTCGASRGGHRRSGHRGGENLRGAGRLDRCSIADSRCRGRGRRRVVFEALVIRANGS